MKYTLPKPAGKYGYTKKQITLICKDLKISINKFDDAFGVNTAAIDEKGEINFYLCDIESALSRLGFKQFQDHGWD